MTPLSLVLVYPDDGGRRASEMSLNLYQTTRCHTPEDSSLRGRHRENRHPGS